MMDNGPPAVAAFFARNAASLGRASALSGWGGAGSLATAQAIPDMTHSQKLPRASNFAMFLVLLVVPVIALCRLATRENWFMLASIPVTASFFTYLAYWRDKRSAEAGERRIPEITLHLAELIGGWPGAFLAQRKFRHKTSKFSYQVVFWVVVMLHQYVALDSLLGWRLAKGAVHLFRA